MTPMDLDSLRATRLTEEQVLDVVLITYLCNFVTCLADGLGVEVEDAKARFVVGWLEQRPDPAWRFLRVTAPAE